MAQAVEALVAPPVLHVKLDNDTSLWENLQHADGILPYLLTRFFREKMNSSLGFEKRAWWFEGLRPSDKAQTRSARDIFTHIRPHFPWPGRRYRVCEAPWPKLSGSQVASHSWDCCLPIIPRGGLVGTHVDWFPGSIFSRGKDASCRGQCGRRQTARPRAWCSGPLPSSCGRPLGVLTLIAGGVDR